MTHSGLHVCGKNQTCAQTSNRTNHAAINEVTDHKLSENEIIDELNGNKDETKLAELQRAWASKRKKD